MGSVVVASPAFACPDQPKNTNQQPLSVTFCTWGDEQLGQMREGGKKRESKLTFHIVAVCVIPSDTARNIHLKDVRKRTQGGKYWWSCSKQSYSQFLFSGLSHAFSKTACKSFLIGRPPRQWRFRFFLNSSGKWNEMKNGTCSCLYRHF